MNHTNESNIKCPYCDYEWDDSWEFGEDNGTHTCGSCEKEFNVERVINVTYNTSRINCEEIELKHDYQFESMFVGKRKFEKGVWSDLAESEWTYRRIVECSVCEDKEYIPITKEEYEHELSKSKF